MMKVTTNRMIWSEIRKKIAATAVMMNTIRVVIGGLAARRPGDLLALGAHFLQELEGTGSRHAVVL